MKSFNLVDHQCKEDIQYVTKQSGKSDLSFALFILLDEFFLLHQLLRLIGIKLEKYLF